LRGNNHSPKKHKRRPHLPTIWAWSIFLTSFCLLAGCGYVRTQVTATPRLPTPTETIQFAMPQRNATSTPIPSTPLPTSTPTPTATPLVHIVQKGDLLIHIATQYDVSMDDIIEANGIDNPHALPIGKRLIIPRSQAQVLAAQPTATPTPVPLEIVGVGMYRTPAGSLWCMGEVYNERDHAVDLIQVQVQLYNVEGELIDRAAAFTLSDVVPSGSSAPFAILLPSASAAAFASYQIDILSAQPIENWGTRHRALSIEDTGWQNEGKTVVVRGMVVNQGQNGAEDIRITITAYDAEDVVVAVRQLGLDTLLADQEQTFEVSLIPAKKVARIDAVAWGMTSQP
jgi:LysM repeat protein